MVPAVFSSFDGTEKAEGFLARPDRYRHLFDACADAKTFIPRGAGLSYCNAAAGRGVATICTLAFNRILDFSAETGIVEVEPGIRLGDLFAFSVPRGFLLPIMPGHPSITVGGCIGASHGRSLAKRTATPSRAYSLRTRGPSFLSMQMENPGYFDEPLLDVISTSLSSTGA